MPINKYSRLISGQTISFAPDWARVAGGDTRIAAVARQLATTTRTLQRRLSTIGISYQELVDAARREAAARLLADRALAVAEVAYLLGYSEPAAFHHVFKRWTDETPQAFRQRRSPRS